ncbi:MAG: type VI secretion system tip protein VgrG [Fluviicola sp.]
MNNSGVLKTDEPKDLVTRTLLVNGEEVSGTYQIMSMVVDRVVNRIPCATVIILDGDASLQDFEVSAGNEFVPGNEVQINVGYHSDEEQIFKGIIVKHSIKLRGGTTYLTLECKDELVKTTIGRKSRYYTELSDSEVFEQILDGYGIQYEIEPTNFEHPELVQYNSSDWDFIVSRAQANGKLCFVNDGVISIKAPTLNQEEVETITYGATLYDFDAEMDARNQFNTITSYSWNKDDLELVGVEAEDPGVSLNGNVSSSELANVIGLDNYELRHGGNLNDLELQNWADATQLYQQMAKVRGSLRFQGIPKVNPDTILLLDGLGDRFNGSAYVSGVRHTVGEGNWLIDAQFGLNPKWFSETYEINTCPAAGLLPAIKGLHIGIVSQLQDDPEGSERILVKLPIISSEEQGIWCRLATLDAGENRGSVFRPEIDDEVIVGFINEDPNDAIILGQLHSSLHTAPIPASDDNHEKGFVTRSEMKLVFDDDKKSITIETPAGKKVQLDEDGGTISIEDENSNSIVMDSDGITIKSGKDLNLEATGDVNVSGINIDVAANASFKADGGAGAEVTTSAVAVLKGSIVQIN